MRIHVPAVAAAYLSLSVLCAQAVDPVGLVHPAAQPLANVAVFVTPGIDRVALQSEDVQRRLSGLPARYAVPHRVQLDPKTHGTWEVLDATWSLWRLRIQAPDASHVNLGIERFAMPAGARFMVYSSDYSAIVRPFDSADHAPSGELWTPVVRTSEIVTEVYVHTTDKGLVQLAIAQVGSGYRFFGAGPDALGLDGSGPCQVDVACPAAAAWADEIPSVAAISTGGSIFCTGFMVNNTAENGANYFITAHHCGVTAGLAPSLVAYWNYENTTCGGAGANFTQFNTGSTLRASWATSDFTLVEFTTPPSPAWGVTYAGWNRSVSNALSAVGIHHPSGDAKKWSQELQPTQTTSYGGFSSPGDGTHVRLVDWDTGTTEPGSSGSPLFDQNHRVIGQLHGGGSACGLNLSDWYGKFSASWTGGGTNGTRLSNWLDPIGSGAIFVDTRVPVVASASVYGLGCYQTRGCFAQTFATAGTFDLSGTATTTLGISFAPQANGYTVQAGPDAWFTPVSANLGLPDNAVATLNLPFAFVFPGGSTSTVRMSSNGFVWLDGVSADDNTPTSFELSTQAARFAPMWMNLNPAQGGSCHFDTDPSGNAVYFTWLDVPAFTAGPPGAGNTFQLVLRADQTAEFRYRLVPSQPLPCVVGWSRGGQFLPLTVDLSTGLPFSISIDQNALGFSPVGRPLLGTTQVVNLANIPNPAASIGLVLIGWSFVAPPVDLGIVGAPGCLLHVNYATIEAFFPVVGTTHPWGLPIPNTQSLNGASVFVQGGLLVPPGTNSLGLLTSNGVQLNLGNT